MIICRLIEYPVELTYTTLEEAVEGLEAEEGYACDDDEDLAETYFHLKCDVLNVIEYGNGNYVEDENGNLVFEW